VATFGIPGTPGVTAGSAADTIVLPWGHAATVQELLHTGGHHVACVILEPVPANIGVLPPPEGFLAALREITEDAGTLLVFDEVITGFRIARGGAQERFGVRPDLTVLGKVMGGGFPCAAFGGRADVMDQLAPDGPVYQAGTLSGNPVAVAAGLAALELVDRLDPYEALDRTAASLTAALADALSGAGIQHTMNRVGSLFSVFFAEPPVPDAAAARAADHRAYARFFHAMLERGVYLPPSGFEAWFLSTAHGQDELERVFEAAREAAKEVAATEGS
jgi:glutamate-1-semialdehyde 2,1-aminomutase